DMVRPAWPEPDARAVVQIQSSALFLASRNFQSLLTPDALHPLVIDPPALYLQQRCDAFVSIAAVLCRQPDDVPRQRVLIIASFDRFPERAAALAQGAACFPLRTSQYLLNMNDGLTPAFRRGQNFPLETSFNIWLSTVSSATARLRRLFSTSSSFRRF